MWLFRKWFFRSKSNVVNGTNVNTDISKAVETFLYTLYPHLKPICENTMYQIPGLKQTLTLREERVKICHHMDPQGMAMMKDHVLISAYNRQPFSKKSKYNSVIYVLDRSTGAYVKSIVLPGCPHAGGLAYDRKAKRLWVATKVDGYGALSAISYQTIMDYDFITDHRPITYDFTIVCKELKNVSFVTMDANYLYAGLYHLQGGPIYRYSLDRNRVPNGTFAWLMDEAKMQGLAIYKEYILISSSSGPRTSQLLVYKGNQLMRSIDFPPYMEQIVVYKDVLYILFESGGSAFSKYKKIPHIDWILKVNMKDIIEQC